MVSSPSSPPGRPRASRAARSRPVAAAVLVAAAACDVGDPIAPSNELPEDPGTIIAAAGSIQNATNLAWSADGSVLTFVTGTGTLAALDLGSGQVAIIDGARDEHAELSAARAGGAVYFLADRSGGRRSAYRLAPGGSAVRLTSRAPGSGPLVPGDGTLVAGGPGDRETAYVVDPDSLYVFDNAKATQRFVTAGCTRIVAFSPTGSRVLCKRPTQGTYGIFALADGALETVALQPSETESLLLRTRWSEDDTIHTLYRTATRFRLRSAATGSAFSLWMPVSFGGVQGTDFQYWSWSADGGRFVFWIHECLKLDRLGGCGFGQSVLYAVDIPGNTGRPVAVVKGEHGAERVAISPDGRRLAFVFENRLHIQVIP